MTLPAVHKPITLNAQWEAVTYYRLRGRQTDQAVQAKASQHSQSETDGVLKHGQSIVSAATKREVGSTGKECWHGRKSVHVW